jgi:hypothetical protein
MSKKINNLKKNDVIVNSKDNKITHPVFCFRYLTNNKNYNFNYFNTDNERNEVYRYLYEKIITMSNSSWREFFSKPKISGLETIEYKDFNFNVNKINLSKDDKLISIRFANQKYRIIGQKSELNDCVFHVLGFDFDHSAYNHG